MPARFVTSLVRHLLNHTLLLGILLGASISGIPTINAAEVEPAPAKAESVDVEVLVAERHCRQQNRRNERRGTGLNLLPFHLAHSPGQAPCLATLARAEHTLRNGGLGTALRC